MKLYIDPIGNTMNVWWDDPKHAASSEEVDEPTRNDIIVKDKTDTPIGIEFIGLFPRELNLSEMAKTINGSAKQPFLLSSHASDLVTTTG